MNKLLLALLPLVLLSIGSIGLIYWNMQKGCEVYGGFVGQSQKCTCLGVIIEQNPLDATKFPKSTLESGFSSNFCLGIITEVKNRPF